MKYAPVNETSRPKYQLLEAWFRENEVVAQYHELPGGGRIYSISMSYISKLQVDINKPGPLFAPVDIVGDGSSVAFGSFSDFMLSIFDSTPRATWVWVDV